VADKDQEMSYAIPVRVRWGEPMREVHLKELPYAEKYQLVKSHWSITKDEILSDIMENEGYKRLRRIARVPEPSEFFDNYTELNRRFYRRVREMVIFEELPLGWIYEQEITYKGAKLMLQHVKDIEVDEEDQLRGYTIDASYPLCVVPSELLSVGQYAERYKVGEGTVRQWIRRGKLRTAIKNGNQWLIPLLTLPPSRGYVGAQFKWEPPLKNVPEEYMFLNEYRLATFAQDGRDRKKFYVFLVPKLGENGEVYHAHTRELESQEREALELFMISSSEIDYVSSF